MAEDLYKKDLQLTRRTWDQQVSDRDYVDLVTGKRGDLATVEGRDNLVQAIINRLLTRRGELAALGHPNYGSRLYLLPGELNNLRVRGLADIYIREALAQEPRISEVVSIAFDDPNRSSRRHTMEVTLVVRSKKTGEDLTLNLPINLGG